MRGTPHNFIEFFAKIACVAESAPHCYFTYGIVACDEQFAGFTYAQVLYILVWGNSDFLQKQASEMRSGISNVGCYSLNGQCRV